MGEIDRAKARHDVIAAVARPTGEQHSSTVPELAGLNLGLPGWSHFMPMERETAPAWQGRKRVETVQSMLNDTQVSSLRQAIRLPAHRYVIELEPAGAAIEACTRMAADLDVPLVGEPEEQRPGRRAERFSSRRQLDRAMDALDYGHAVFEHAGRIDDDGWWRLVDLAPVPQWTIDDPDSWEIDRRGRLLNVVQRQTNPPTELPIDHLAVFTWQGAPGDPRGRSMLRPLYSAWLLRDRTLRVMGMSSERTGMGIPVGKVPPGAAEAKAVMERLLSRLAAGEDTNLVLETDAAIRDSLMLMGVTGSTPDLVGMLRYYDESMARATLAMLLQLGQTETGSRALGGTFDDLLADYHDAVLDWFCDVMTQQVCEPWIDRNPGGIGAPAPRLVWKRREPAAPPPSSYQYDLEFGILTVDDRRAQLGLAPLPDGAGEGRAIPADELRLQQQEARQQGDTAAARSPAAQRRAAAVRSSFAAIAGRQLRREPTEAELSASVDFALLEAQHVAATDDLAAVLLRDRDELAGVAVDLVAEMRSVDPLTLGATLAPALTEHAAGMDTEPLVTLLIAAADQGVEQVVGEAARQGVSLEASVDYTERAELEAREMHRRMATQIAENAAAVARTQVAPGAARRGLLARLRPASMAAGEADAIAAHLASLSPAAAEAAAAGGASRAMNTGRFEAIAAAPTQEIYASEILDDATCFPCQEIDGTSYDTLEEALQDYPSMGGYLACEGMDRCRGTLVATFGSESEAQA